MCVCVCVCCILRPLFTSRVVIFYCHSLPRIRFSFFPHSISSFLFNLITVTHDWTISNGIMVIPRSYIFQLIASILISVYLANLIFLSILVILRGCFIFDANHVFDNEAWDNRFTNVAEMLWKTNYYYYYCNFYYKCKAKKINDEISSFIEYRILSFSTSTILILWNLNFFLSLFLSVSCFQLYIKIKIVYEQMNIYFHNWSIIISFDIQAI